MFCFVSLLIKHLSHCKPICQGAKHLSLDCKIKYMIWKCRYKNIGWGIKGVISLYDVWGKQQRISVIPFFTTAQLHREQNKKNVSFVLFFFINVLFPIIRTQFILFNSSCKTFFHRHHEKKRSINSTFSSYYFFIYYFFYFSIPWFSCEYLLFLLFITFRFLSVKEILARYPSSIPLIILHCFP